MVRRPVTPTRRGTTHVETLHGELCIYEWTTKTVHALNPAAARVWEMCDGNTTVDDMTAAVRRDLDAPGARAIVEHALTQFDRAGLLEPGTLAGVEPQVSRRALLRRIGVAAAIPVVTSIVAPTPLAAQSSHTVTFNVTGGPQSFTVPAGVISLQVDVVGANGGTVPPTLAGAGGRVQATLPVTPLEVLTIMVGGPGSTSSAGFNGGGAGSGGGFGGGGASDIRRAGTRLIVAGGGGAAGPVGGGNGGAGGGLVGGSGTGTCGGGGGGTQSGGGAGGPGGPGGTAGSPGVSGTGGQGALPTPPNLFGGGGGGGGYFGGGGGGSCVSPPPPSAQGGAGGGGGSSFADPSATSVVHTQGFSGSPHITLSW
jgi:hypothetical protein